MTDRRALTALTLRNARCFGAQTVTIPLHPRATVILGENGAGKSTLTEVLAALGDDDPEVPPVAPWRRGADDGEAALFDGGPDPVATWSWSREAGERFTRERAPLLFAYGPYRRVLRDDDRWRARLRDDLPSYLRRRRTVTLRQPDMRLLHDLREVLIFLWEEREYEPRAREAWARLDDSLRAMNVGLDGVEVRIENDQYVPRVIRQGVALALEELSDGYQSVLIVAFDLILRAVRLPDWYAGEARPVVVVDEIDLHLHPRWQRAVVRQLLALFPDAQFVFPTRAYDWDNFLFACELCNQKKSDRWPAHGRFVRPDHDDPRRHLEFTEDGRVHGRTREGWQTIIALDLNREALVRARRTQIDLVLRPLRLAREAGVDAVWLRVLIEGAIPAAEVAFSGSVTACLERLHRTS
jgi:energy-coupling factor transporter ATP-binding protein EcfA2